MGPCQFGFKCPHRCMSDEGDILCIHPYTPALADYMRAMDLYDESQEFPMVEETDCPITDPGSELDMWMLDMEGDE